MGSTIVYLFDMLEFLKIIERIQRLSYPYNTSKHHIAFNDKKIHFSNDVVEMIKIAEG